MNSLLAYIPAPPFNQIGFVYVYGITMAIGVFLATYIANYRYAKKHDGSTLVVDIFIPVLISGLIGARVYHLFTGYDFDRDGISGIFKLRNGGLSIWGAVIGGALAVFILSKIKKFSFIEMADAVVVGLCIGQFVGRFGNYFNQELFGKPFSGPWALKVDAAFRPVGYESFETFHPTFIYEGLICLAIAFLILRVEKQKSWPRGASFAMYIFLYCLGRAFMEVLRIDDAQKIFGVRFNLLLSLVLALCAFVWLLFLKKQSQDADGDKTAIE